jgi:drug/metabolite transporter (DMT)-like permease
MTESESYAARLRVHLLLFCSTTLVSTSFIVAEIIAGALDPLVLTFVRFVVAALMLLPVVAIRHGVKISVSAFAGYALISGCLVVFFWAMFMSLRFTTPLNISVLFTLVPAVSALFAALINREKIGFYLLCGLVVGLAGAVWVIFEGDLGLISRMQWNRGDLIFSGGCLAMACYTPLIRRVHHGEPMEVMTFWVLVSGCLWMLPGIAHILPSVPVSAIDPSVWLWIVYLALFSTVVSFYMTQSATRVIGPTRTISYSYLYPMLVVVLEFLIGRGWPPLQIFPGIVLTFAAMLLVVRSSKDRQGAAVDG